MSFTRESTLKERGWRRKSAGQTVRGFDFRPRRQVSCSRRRIGTKLFSRTIRFRKQHFRTYKKKRQRTEIPLREAGASIDVVSANRIPDLKVLPRLIRVEFSRLAIKRPECEPASRQWRDTHDTQIQVLVLFLSLFFYSLNYIIIAHYSWRALELGWRIVKGPIANLERILGRDRVRCGDHPVKQGSWIVLSFRTFSDITSFQSQIHLPLPPSTVSSLQCNSSASTAADSWRLRKTRLRIANWKIASRKVVFWIFRLVGARKIYENYITEL